MITEKINVLYEVLLLWVASKKFVLLIIFWKEEKKVLFIIFYIRDFVLDVSFITRLNVKTVFKVCFF